MNEYEKKGNLKLGETKTMSTMGTETYHDEC